MLRLEDRQPVAKLVFRQLAQRIRPGRGGRDDRLEERSRFGIAAGTFGRLGSVVGLPSRGVIAATARTRDVTEGRIAKQIQFGDQPIGGPGPHVLEGSVDARVIEIADGDRRRRQQRGRSRNIQCDRKFCGLGGTDQRHLECEGSQIRPARSVCDVQQARVSQSGQRCVPRRPPHILHREGHPVAMADRNRLADGDWLARLEGHSQRGVEQYEAGEKRSAKRRVSHAGLFG